MTNGTRAIRSIVNTRLILVFIALFVSVQSNADISITGSAKIKYIDSESSLVDSTNVSTNFLQTDAVRDKHLARDLFVIPALLTSLFPGELYFDISKARSKSSFEALLIPPCCLSQIPLNLSHKPTIESDKNLSILFNKTIDNSPFYITGSYQKIDSSRQSIFPSRADLEIGCLSCVNLIDRDIMRERESRLGFGFKKAISPIYSVYVSTAYTNLYLEYIPNGGTLDFLIPNLSQKAEGRVETYGVNVYPYKDFMIDISKDIYNLNNLDVPDKRVIKLVYKINNTISIGLDQTYSEYENIYQKGNTTEESLFLRTKF